MKYYINREKEILLQDNNVYPPHIIMKGFEEITKEEYDQKSEEKLRELEEGE